MTPPLAPTGDRRNVVAELLGMGSGHDAHRSSGTSRHHKSGVTYPCSRPDYIVRSLLETGASDRDYTLNCDEPRKLTRTSCATPNELSGSDEPRSLVELDLLELSKCRAEAR